MKSNEAHFYLKTCNAALKDLQEEFDLKEQLLYPVNKALINRTRLYINKQLMKLEKQLGGKEFE